MNTLRRMRRKKGLTLVELAKRAGTSASQISKLETGHRQLSERWIERLAAALECCPEQICWIAASSVEVPDGDENWWAGFRSLPVFDLAARIGPDGDPIGGNILYVQVFREDWLQTVSSSPPDRLAVFRVDNDAMEPTFKPGDHILVELISGKLGRNGIYVIQIGNMLEVKRVTVNPATELITVASDNQHYEKFADLKPEQVQSAGRVLWGGRRF